jgi:hypothetical protein
MVPVQPAVNNMYPESSPSEEVKANENGRNLVEGSVSGGVSEELQRSGQALPRVRQNVNLDRPSP